MTWGVILPSGFGTYWPDGSYVDSEARAEAYYRSTNPDASEQTVPAGVAKILSETTLKCRADRELGPLEEHEKQRAFRTRKTYPKLASLIQLNDGLVAVDSALHEIIESLEPGVHQFWPIKIIMPGDVEYPTPYFGMVVQTHLTAFNRDGSKPGSWKSNGSTDHYSQPTIPEKKAIQGMAISLDVVGDAHIWREKWLRSVNYQMSDTLMSRIRDANLSIPPKHYKMLDV